MRRTRSNHSLGYYLVLNMLVSAATTLAVLFAWDYFTGRDLPASLAGLAAAPPAAGAETAAGGSEAGGLEAGAPTAAANQPGIESTPPAEPAPAALPPPDVEVIEITLVAGAGDLDQEVLTLRRVGEGDLFMAGWKLYDESGSTYIFPTSPELVLFAGGAVRFYSKGGTDTATEIYWNRTEPAYQSTELITLEDPQGNVRATYRVP